jgi:hypothetical protein
METEDMAGRRIFALIGLLLGWGAACVREEPQQVCTQEELGGLYARRIEPLLAEDRPKSCNECHLSGIDLSLFVRGDACRTMACMTEQGLVDLERPEDSKILQWIDRANPSSPLITESVIQEEYDGFLEWIRWSQGCGGEVCGQIEDPCAGGSGQLDCAMAEDHDEGEPFVDPGDCSDLTREAVFREKVFAWRGRCSPCHYEGAEVPPTIMAPVWIAAGPCNQASLTTMRTVLARDYIDLEQPDQSLLLLKPLAEGLGGVEHGGGDKFHTKDDSAYVDFLYWITREQGCQAAGP